MRQEPNELDCPIYAAYLSARADNVAAGRNFPPVLWHFAWFRWVDRRGVLTRSMAAGPLAGLCHSRSLAPACLRAMLRGFAPLDESSISCPAFIFLRLPGEMTRTATNFVMSNTSPVSPLALLLLCGNLRAEEVGIACTTDCFV